MKKHMKRRLLAVLLTAMMLLTMVIPSNAAELGSAVEVEDESELYGSSSDSITLTATATFESATKEAILARVNEIRKEAYEEGLVSKYVPMKWSTELEQIAMTRAFEGSISWSHTRPDGSSCFTATSNGISSSGENIAWGASILGAINMYYGEKDAYVNNTGGVTGHYTNMIKPDKCYMGTARYGYTSALETGYSTKSETKLATTDVAVSFVVPKSDVTFSISGDSSVASNKTYTYKLSAVYDGNEYSTSETATWSSSNTSVGTISSDGKFKAIEEGTTTLKATVDGKTVSKQVTVYDVVLNYCTHVQDIGWQSYVSSGEMSGTSGKSKRLEGIKIKLESGYDLGIQYTVHAQDYGWMSWCCNDEMSGTEGESKRLEAIKIQLTGSDAGKFDVYYRVHAQDYGWLAWAKNGAPAGTAGQSKRLEGIQIVVVRKTTAAPGTTYNGIKSDNSKAYVYSTGSATVNVSGASDVNVAYRTHVQNQGWQGWKYNGGFSGTSGLSYRLEGIYIRLTNNSYGGSIKYRTHVQDIGWQDWRYQGVMSGTSGQSKRLEAIQIELTGTIAEKYDVYYRVHAQNIGWMGWAKNGESAGTAGLSYRLEGIQIVLVKKGGAAPSASYRGLTQTTSKCFVQG